MPWTAVASIDQKGKPQRCTICGEVVPMQDTRKHDREQHAPEVPEHAFKPGDGENTYVDVCQICQHHLSEHEEGEPCCIAFVTSGGRDHTPDCKEA